MAGFFIVQGLVALLVALSADGLSLLPMSRRQAFVATASAVMDTSSTVHATDVETDDDRHRREETLRRLQERRQLMQASRSTNNRQAYLDLSRQRAALYNTTFQGVTCPPNIPCI